MSGLLDKANETAKDADKVTTSMTDAVIDEPNSSIESEVDKKILISLQVGGVIGLLFSLFLLIQTGWLYATLVDYTIAFMVLLVGWSLLNGADYISSSMSGMKMAITAFAFAGLFIATIVGTVFMNAGGAVTIASIEMDGDKNEIDLSFYGPRGMGYTIEILVDDVVQYSHDAEINIDRGSHSVSLDDFWAGNSMNMNDRSEVTYQVIVTSEGGQDSVNFDDLMNREVDTGFVRVNEVFTTDSQTGDKEYTGIAVEMIIGMGDPDASFDFANNYFTGTAPKTIVSDWTATLKVKSGNNIEYQYSTIQSNEGVVNGLGEFWSGWVMMPGTNAGNLDRDDFYSGDGCYTFEIEIINEHGETYVDSSSQISFNWDSNEAGGDEPATAC